jgi:hypothetical protein
LRRLRNPVVIFGIVIVLLCWVGACLQVFAERAAAIRAAIERGDIAARLFEKDAVSLFKGIDMIMLLLGQAYEDDPQHFDLIGLARKAGWAPTFRRKSAWSMPMAILRRGQRAFCRLRFTSGTVCIFGPRPTQSRTISSSAPLSSREPQGNLPFRFRAGSAPLMVVLLAYSQDKSILGSLSNSPRRLSWAQAATSVSVGLTGF